MLPVKREDSPTTTKILLRSLRAVEHLPIDYSDALFAHYPSLKLGVTKSVEYFGPQLARLAEDVIMQSLPGLSDWVITAPSYNVLPGGPNLLCSYIYEELTARLAGSATLSLAYLRDQTAGQEISDSESLHKYHNYSTFTKQERTELYQQTPEPLFEPGDFQGRSVIFVNDMRVTGSHERYIQQALAKVEAAQICWLYILKINPAIAEAQPELEYAINHSRLAGFEEFAELLATHHLQYTSRCITRILSYELSQLKKLLAMLDNDRKKTILELATAEGRFSGEYFREKIGLLRSSIG